jgi:hypothetical protein
MSRRPCPRGSRSRRVGCGYRIGDGIKLECPGQEFVANLVQVREPWVDGRQSIQVAYRVAVLPNTVIGEGPQEQALL